MTIKKIFHQLENHIYSFFGSLPGFCFDSSFCQGPFWLCFSRPNQVEYKLLKIYEHAKKKSKEIEGHKNIWGHGSLLNLTWEKAI